MKIMIGTQMYPWLQDCHRRGVDFNAHLDDVLARTAAAGLAMFEHTLGSEADVLTIAPLLRRHELAMPVAYCGGVLHDERSTATIATIVRLATLAAEKCGVRIINVNPDPIAWGQPHDKSDAQLRHQAAALGNLGARLAAAGIRLAYHIHAPEMRAGAREFHFMLTANDPKDVGLCLDTHWIYRGAGNSQAALESVLALYGPRIASLHLRQSHNGVWSEYLAPGDIDYDTVATALRGCGFSGPATLEQAFETGTPHTMDMTASLRHGADFVRRVFAKT